MAGTQLIQVGTSPPNTNSRKIWTFSFWLKRSKLGAEQCVWTTRTNGSNNHLFRFNADDTFTFKGAASGSDIMNLISNAKFRDCNAWYHFVLAVDSTQGTASNRARVYVNGSEITSYSTADYGAQNESFEINEQGNQPFFIGSESSQNYFDGLMSYFAFVSGTQEAPTIFGETDSTTGEWKIKTTITPSSAWGTNGFFILKDGNSVTDQSGNSSNFQVHQGTLTSTKDCPSNVYCVWNAVVKQTGEMTTIGNGNTYLRTQNDSTWRSAYGTIGFQGTGKFYAEFKCGNLGGTQHLGIVDVDQQNSDNGSKFSNASRAYAYANNGQKVGAGSQSSYGNSWDSGAYLQIAYNNGAIWFGKDGTWQNSATISEINAGTTTNAAFTGIDTSKTYTIGWNGYADDIIELNAGNGWFRTTEIGSPNNPSSGDTEAKFKYTVPTAHQPISTKALNE